MGKKETPHSARVLTVMVKGLILGGLVTGAAILILALLLYKTGLSENNLHIAVIVVYALSCLISGIYCGKKLRERRFMWGLLAGVLYYAVLLAISTGLGGSFSVRFISSALVCLGSGMLGGMLS